MDQMDKKPPDRIRTMMSYEETFQFDEWEASRKCADEMMRTIPRLKEDFVLDQITLGDGQCFSTACIQQMRRPDINKSLDPKWQKYSWIMDSRAFKFQVRKFMQACQHQQVQALKGDWQNFTGMRWEEYWGANHIMKKSTWVDHEFIQSAAWFLQLDIVIHQDISGDPVRIISGNIEDDKTPCSGPTLHIGYLFGRHYQSLLPKGTGDARLRKRKRTPEDVQSGVEKDVLKSKPVVKKVSENTTHKNDKEVKASESCPVCKKSFKNVLLHIKRVKTCKNGITDQDLLSLRSQSEMTKKENSRKRQANFRNDNPQKAKQSRNKSMAKHRKFNPEKAKEDNKKSMAKHRKLNPEKAKEDRIKSMAKHRKLNPEKTRIANQASKAKHRKLNPEKTRIDNQASKAKHRKLNPEKTRIDNQASKAKQRECNNELDRLKNFRDATMYGPIFLCISCHIKCFKTNVQLFKKDLIHQKYHKCIGDCIDDENLKTRLQVKMPNTSMIKDHVGETFICKNCVKYLKKGTIPPSSVMNSLKLNETDEEIKEQKLVLTELEGALIAKTIIFQKIFLLPKSRWTAVKDKTINVPITDDAINHTLTQLPRTPAQAGLIGIKLKRKKEFKNSHISQLIDPAKIFRMLKKLKKDGNPHYQSLFTPEEFRLLCKRIDTSGYGMIYGNDDVLENLDATNPDTSMVVDELLNEEKSQSEESDESSGDSEDSNNEKETENKEEVEAESSRLRKKKGIKKDQFVYDTEVCMMDKYPEISVAPGEGQVPENILYSKDWDIKAFPQLHNSDGSNGKDAERKVKLTDQRYFIQRICNKETRFAKSPAYLYSAVTYLELKQISNNISLAGVRGKKTTSADGSVSYSLDDEFTVLENMKNTPRYWRKAKYEMLAKLDNFGPFHIFFTLSCADRRWEPNFAAILLERGYEIQYSCQKTDEDYEVLIEARLHGQDWKPIMQFIEEDLEESLHELIRGNVVTATRYYHHRVKNFINNIVLDKSNPLCVRYYTYKVEMQQRGAAHIHGTLWLDTKKIEQAVCIDEKLILNMNFDGPCPMKGLTEAFKKLRYNEDLNEDNIKSLTNFIDNFITVCTHGNTVGNKVSQIVREVNEHHHTKTCQKNGFECRFHYPRPPAPFTIIQQPKKKSSLCFERRNIIIDKVMEIVSEKKNIEKIMKHFEKEAEDKELFIKNRMERIKSICALAEVTYSDYLEALSMSKTGYTVVLARDIDELNINPFNIEWITAWNGNMDIQPCLDFFAVISYITDYYSKDDTGTMEIMKKVMENSDKKELQERMKQVANTFLTHRQIGEAEAVYRLIPSMTLSMSNVTCQFVQTAPKEERSIMWKKATEEQLEAGIKAVKLDKREGYWYEQPDLWSKYLRRPPELEELCYAQFARMYKGSTYMKFEEDDDNEMEETIEKKIEVEDYNEKFHSVMTYREEGARLPEHIELEDPRIGEVSYMRRRNFPAALRFHRVKKDKDPKRFMLNEVMLYYPLRNEVNEDNIELLYEETHGNKRKVDIVKGQVMEFLEDVQEARYYVDQLKTDNEMELKETAMMLDPTGEQENEDCEDEGNEEHGNFECFNPEEFLANESSVHQQSIYRRVDLLNKHELREKTRTLDENQREVLNVVIKYAKDIVKSRQNGNNPPEAELLMVHGGAGAGKSTVIHVIEQWATYILRKEGDDLDQPCVIKAAFTGCAASNIKGQTLHQAFGFSFSDKHFSLSDKIRDKRRAELKNLKIVIIDEISMVKVDMLYMLDLRLQEITQKIGKPFGGISIIVFGDMMQLRPCLGRFICEVPRNPEFQITHKLMPRWEMFRSILLTQNHRQGKDKTYADLLNRVRVGQHTNEDIDLLKSRIRTANHQDIKNVDMFIGCKRKDVAERNIQYLAQMKGKLQRMKAIHHTATKKKFKPKISKKDGNVGDTSLIDELILKIGAQVMIVHNIDTLDQLTNGQIGVLIDFIQTEEKKIEILVIKLKDQSAGSQNKIKHSVLSKKFPECVFIKRTSIQYSVRKKSGDVGSVASVIQFPVKLAHAITAHKVQGNTIVYPSKVLLDLTSVFEPAQAYVMLSRVQCIDQVFIYKELSEKKIRTSTIGLEELERLKKISLNENPTHWNKRMESMKIAFVNCAGLVAHLADIKCDKKLLKADLLHLDETHIEEEFDEFAFQIDGFHSHFINCGNGKGVATYSTPDIDVRISSHKERTLQIAKVSMKELDSINLYRSSNKSISESLETLREILDPDKATIITGDFNICLRKHRTNVLTKALNNEGFEQLQNEASHIMGGTIDHVYWRDPIGQWNKPIIERYSPYFSDHDGFLLTLTKKVKRSKLRRKKK